MGGPRGKSWTARQGDTHTHTRAHTHARTHLEGPCVLQLNKALHQLDERFAVRGLDETEGAGVGTVAVRSDSDMHLSARCRQRVRTDSAAMAHIVVVSAWPANCAARRSTSTWYCAITGPGW